MSTNDCHKYLGAPDCKGNTGTSAVADLCCEQIRVRVILGTISFIIFLQEMLSSYNLATINANDEVIPRLNGNFEVLVSQDLKAKGTISFPGALWRKIRVETGYEPIKSSEHDFPTTSARKRCALGLR